MSHIIEHNRYVYKRGATIVLIQKIQDELDLSSKRFDCHVFSSQKDYWQFVGQLLAETQNYSRQRALGWNEKTPFQAVDYAKIYESKLRNARPFEEMTQKFRISNHARPLATMNELIHSFNNDSQWFVKAANYFTAKGAM